jgi:hypothetical protein
MSEPPAPQRPYTLDDDRPWRPTVQPAEYGFVILALSFFALAEEGYFGKLQLPAASGEIWRVYAMWRDACFKPLSDLIQPFAFDVTSTERNAVILVAVVMFPVIRAISRLYVFNIVGAWLVSIVVFGFCLLLCVALATVAPTPITTLLLGLGLPLSRLSLIQLFQRVVLRSDAENVVEPFSFKGRDFSRLLFSELLWAGLWISLAVGGMYAYAKLR